ncbi:Beta-glucuronosyltransferase [Actinidia chinensis var. chinensis]|uniref:Beta-glucuronosyltransferase n=1 Tax=Actinidia chinensis var. chinensis TaxID=1590841 RepID=A0A2R6R0N1_ACTCC|nr:Beta-glucuronosyltransferase [Actinidia chinensis var. chinensis]
MRVPSEGPNDPPVLAYYVSGSHGDGKKVLRLLKAIYHQRNQYLLQLDRWEPRLFQLRCSSCIASQDKHKLGLVCHISSMLSLFCQGISILSISRGSLAEAKIRTRPDAFRIFGGSTWMILSKAFMEYCVRGWDNLPRKLLTYFTTVAFPLKLKLYFHTVLCNSPEFRNTTVDNDLWYVIWDATADPFREGDPVLYELDKNVLNLPRDGAVPGKWCLDRGMNASIDSSITRQDNCSS